MRIGRGDDGTGVSSTVATAGRMTARWPHRLLRRCVGLFAVAGVVAAHQVLFGPPQTGHFRSAGGRAAYMAAYDEAMLALPTPSTVHDVLTGWGSVRVYEWTPSGLEDSIPVVLLPGRGSGSPMWSENLADFASHRRVLAVDALGDAGLSVQGVPMVTVDDQASWLHEVLSELAPAGAHVVGHSFGAAVAAAYARSYPSEIVSLTLLEPVLTFGYPSPRMMAWTVVVSLPYLPRTVRETALGRIGGGTFDDTEPLARMIAAGTEHYVAALPNPSRLSDDEVAQLTMPVYVAIASDNSLAGGGSAAARARSTLSDGVVEIWPHTTHSLPMEVAGPLSERLGTFWNASESRR
jgi:pimeloyl-ACP methyl ester carboxylesterase